MLNSDESRRYGYVEEKEEEDANGGVLVKHLDYVSDETSKEKPE